jgi:hypothetical protein
MTCKSLFGDETERNTRRGKHKLHAYPDIRREAPQLGVQEEMDGKADAADMVLLERLRPKKRSDCHPARKELGVSGCPWVACRHNLLIDVLDGTEQKTDLLEIDAVLLNGRTLERKWTCALDFADAVHAGQFVADDETESDDEVALTPVSELVSNDHVGEALGLSGEWVRLTVQGALVKIRPEMAKLEGRTLRGQR